MSETAAIPRLLTSGRIAEELGESPQRVLYILATRPHIKPCAKAGAVRLFDRLALDSVRDEIKALQSRQNPREPMP